MAQAGAIGAPSWKDQTDTVAGTGDDVTGQLPRRLSPSRASDYAQCPAKFYFRSVLRLASPATEATAKGTLVHEACEHIFDHPRGDRTPEVAVSYIRPAWDKLKDQPDYAPLAAKGDRFVEQMLGDAEELVRRWFKIEDPNRFDPEGRELRLESNIAGVDMLGIIDRLDRVTYPSGAERVIISDYKSGKPAGPDDRYLDEKFFAMKVYAVLVKQVLGDLPFKLRLIYVAGASKDSVRELLVDDRLIASTRARIKSLWAGARKHAKAGRFPTKVQPLCNWCDHQPLCPAWNPELAGEDPDVLAELHANTIGRLFEETDAEDRDNPPMQLRR